MTDIDAIHAHLDLHPGDHSARLVLADALQDAGSPLADGMRGLGVCGRVPMKSQEGFGEPQWYWRVNDDPAHLDPPGSPQILPPDWHGLLLGGVRNPPWQDYETPREANDSAAEAFVRLSADRQRELLAALYTPAGGAA